MDWQLTQLQWWEVLAVVLAVVYLVLAIRQNIWCWAAAAVSTLLYLFIMWQARLYMESVFSCFIWPWPPMAGSSGAGAVTTARN